MSSPLSLPNLRLYASPAKLLINGNENNFGTHSVCLVLCQLFSLSHLILKAPHKIIIIIPILQIWKLKFNKGRARTGLQVYLIATLLRTNCPGKGTQPPSPRQGPPFFGSIALLLLSCGSIAASLRVWLSPAPKEARGRAWAAWVGSPGFSRVYMLREVS